jgi:SAM-dependent methyltransferase
MERPTLGPGRGQRGDAARGYRKFHPLEAISTVAKGLDVSAGRDDTLTLVVGFPSRHGLRLRCSPNSDAETTRCERILSLMATSITTTATDRYVKVIIEPFLTDEELVQHMKKTETCPGCSAPEPEPFFSLNAMPVSVGTLFPTCDAATACPRGDIELVFCRKCGLISNRAFDPSLLDYESEYDNALDFSQVFRQFQRDLAERLIGRHVLRGKNLVEIGCGKGHFLRLICELGDNTGVGFDPTHAVGDGRSDDRVRFVQDEYSSAHSELSVDAVFCRQVFEHIPTPTAFLRELHATLRDRDGAVVYFDVPNSIDVVRDLSVWTVIYEHCNYFTAESLGSIFDSSGFEVCDIYECYDGQFLGVEAKVKGCDLDERPQAFVDVARGHGEMVRGHMATFAERYEEKKRSWQEQLERIRSSGSRTVAWGAGARMVSLFNTLAIGNEIPYVVDINANKHGKFLAGSGQEIKGPEFLREYRPDVVLVMNAIYLDEIRGQLEQFGLRPEYVCA